MDQREDYNLDSEQMIDHEGPGEMDLEPRLVVSCLAFEGAPPKGDVHYPPLELESKALEAPMMKSSTNQPPSSVLISS